MTLYFFADDKYKSKIYSISNLRFTSFIISKIIIFYIFMLIISKLSHILPLSFFFTLSFRFYILTKILIYSIILDIIYYTLFISLKGKYTILEIVVSSCKKPEIKKLLSISISYILIYFLSLNLKQLFPRLHPDYIKDEYDIEPEYISEDEKIYYEQNGLMKMTIYEKADKFFMVCFSIFFVFHFMIIRNNYYLWPKLNLGRFNQFKYNIKKIFWNNIFGRGSAFSFFVIYVVIIYWYHTIFALDLCLNYLCLFLLEYNFIYLSTEFIKIFICAKINSFTNETNSKGKVIRIEIDILKEDNFYIIHHLQHLVGFYKSPYDIKTNINLLRKQDIEALRYKISNFTNSLNQKLTIFYQQKSINQNQMRGPTNAVDKIKYIWKIFFSYIDYRPNEVIENETNVENLKLVIELIGNLILFIADADIGKNNDEKYTEYSECVYFLFDRLIWIQNLLMDLIKSKKISGGLISDVLFLNKIICNYYDLIRNREYKNHFIRIESEKFKPILYGTN